MASITHEQNNDVMSVIFIKPLSVNRAFQGRRFRTPEYNAYEKHVLLLLPNIELPEPPFKIYFEFGLSNIQADLDNPTKPFLDILQKRYCFNDRHVMEANIKKVKVNKGNEYIKFKIESL